jgi:membrane protein implicated in regulation of membrane protease activity
MFDWVLSLIKNFASDATFFVICGIGVVYTLVSLFFGGHGDTDGDGDHGDGDHGQGPGYLSLRGISLFMIGFGAVGGLIRSYTGKPLVASVSGLLAGIVLMVLGMYFLRLFYKSQATSIIQPEQIIGAIGTVTLTIPAKKDGFGEVSLTVSDRQLTKTAITSSDTELKTGTPIKVVSIAGHILEVERL